MKIEVYSNADAVAQKAAALVAAEARTAVAARGAFLMAVSGGHSPWEMLRALAGEDVPWDAVHVVQVDERIATAGETRTEISRTCMRAWLSMRRCALTVSTRCRLNRPTCRRHAKNTRGLYAPSPVHRLCLTSFTWDSDPTATRLRSYPGTRSSRSKMQMLRSQDSTREDDE